MEVHEEGDEQEEQYGETQGGNTRWWREMTQTKQQRARGDTHYKCTDKNKR